MANSRKLRPVVDTAKTEHGKLQRRNYTTLTNTHGYSGRPRKKIDIRIIFCQVPIMFKPAYPPHPLPPRALHPCAQRVSGRTGPSKGLVHVPFHAPYDA